jgi:hypothetical protein
VCVARLAIAIDRCLVVNVSPGSVVVNVTVSDFESLAEAQASASNLTAMTLDPTLGNMSLAATNVALSAGSASIESLSSPSVAPLLYVAVAIHVLMIAVVLFWAGPERSYWLPFVVFCTATLFVYALGVVPVSDPNAPSPAKCFEMTVSFHTGLVLSFFTLVVLTVHIVNASIFPTRLGYQLLVALLLTAAIVAASARPSGYLTSDAQCMPSPAGKRSHAF